MITDLVYLLLFQEISPKFESVATLIPSLQSSEIIIQSNGLFSLKPDSQIPVQNPTYVGPVIEAQSAFAIDLQSNTPLLGKDIFAKRSIASITKLITAMIIIDTHPLDAEVTISKNAATQEGSQMGLRAGEKLTVRALITGMIINSANDAAVALAEFDSGTEELFALKMNERAGQLGLRQSHFTNAKGFDDLQHYSSAFDTMIFGKTATTYPLIREVAQQKSATVTSVDGRVTHKLESTDLLLDNPYYTVLGLKTGTTPLAGESVVSLARLHNGKEVLIVILGSPDRFKETKIILDWIEHAWSWPE